MSLYDIIKKNDYRRLPLDMVRSISKQLLQALSFLQSMNLIHTGKFIYLIASLHSYLTSVWFIVLSVDLKLENVLFVHTTSETRTVHHKDRSFEVTVPKNSRVKCKYTSSLYTMVISALNDDVLKQ